MQTDTSILSDAEILALRPAKNIVDSFRPFHYLVEPERTAAGNVEDAATIFLVNRECPWRCLMCDLWKNTTDESVPAGAVPAQIDYALARLPPARHVKLYNSGNFFDVRAIAPADHAPIAQRVARFATVIVENHPKLCGEACLRFRDLLGTNLEVALGLETVHPDVLPRLNKGMTLDDFARAVEFLLSGGIAVRAFILLRPPYLSETEGIEWAVKSLEYAVSLGVGCCSLIPTRGGNGALARLQAAGDFTPPRLRSLECVLEAGLALGRGRVFADLWDARRFDDCPACGPARVARLAEMNLTQRLPPPVACEACGDDPTVGRVLNLS
ncbi:MAG TPA: radical SAM protein [Pirellulales bacterium]|nr:radical SAM protein [Pirellulales bacterium]